MSGYKFIVSFISVFFMFIFFACSTVFCASAPTCINPNPVFAIPSEELLEPYEILSDGGLENGTADVSLESPEGSGSGAASGALSAVAARTGAYGYYVDASAGAAALAVKTDPDKAEDVKLSLWIKIAGSGTADITPFISFKNADGSTAEDKKCSSVSVGASWTNLVCTASASSNFLYAMAGVEVPRGVALYADDFSVTVPVWKEATVDPPSTITGGVKVPQEPAAPVLLRFSVHVEGQQQFIKSESYFLQKTAVLTELARVFHEHGGFINIQTESEWPLGAERYSPLTLRQLADDYGVTYSVHTHGPSCKDSNGKLHGSAYCSAHRGLSREITDTDTADYIEELRDLLETVSESPVIDLNGNFEVAARDIFYNRGIRIMSAYKNPGTQNTYDYLIVNPWRPSAVNANEDIAGFVTHDSDAKLIYFPGYGQNISKRHRRVGEKIRRLASQFINHASANAVNAMNILLHIDAFVSSEGQSFDDYLKVSENDGNKVIVYSDEFKSHIQYWDEMLEDVIDPLVQAGYLKWADQQEFLGRFTDWEESCSQEDTVQVEASVQSVKSVRIPSEAAGSEGLAVKVNIPAYSRYADGAPVVVVAPGGFDGEGIDASISGLADQGFIQISFNFPGSGEGADLSGGSYDSRGPDSVKALRDVLLFALGKGKDENGRTLADITGPDIRPLYDNVGIAGLSNGGNISLAAAGIYNSRLSAIAWFVNWESPVGDGMPDAEAGSFNGRTFGNPPFNPAYDPDTGRWSLNLLRYDSGLNVNIGNSVHVSGTMEGGFYFDINHNSRLDMGEDFMLLPLLLADTEGSGVHAFYSERVVDYAWSNGLYPDDMPEHLVTPSLNSECWYWRNGEKWIDEIVGGNPNTRFVVIATEKDHVQTAADHPHILIQYQDFIQAGAQTVRLNPDSSYIDLFMSGPPDSAMSDNPAGAEFDHLTIRDALEPDAVSLDGSVIAACCEMADRTRASSNEAQFEPVSAGFYEASQVVQYEYGAGEHCLVLAPEVPDDYDLYSGITTPDGHLFMFHDTNSLVLYDGSLPAWINRPVMLDFLVPESIPADTYTLYNLFVPHGAEPLSLPPGYRLSATRLVFHN